MAQLGARGVPYMFTSGCDASAFPERYRDTPMCLKPFDVESVVATLSRL